MRFLSSLISVAVFVLVVFGAPIYDAASGNWPGHGLRSPADFEEVRSGKYAQFIESELEAGTQLEGVARPRYNELRFLVTGETNPGVVAGKNGWLFLEQRLGKPSPAALAAIPKIVDAMGAICRHLEENGCFVVIELLPRKQTIYPENLPDGLSSPHFPTFDLVYDEMVAEGLRAPDLREVLGPEEGFWYLVNDAHWRPAGAHRVARYVAGLIQDHFGAAGVPGRPFELEFVREEPEEFIGYEQRLLGFAEGSLLYNRYSETIQQIHAADPNDLSRRFFGSLDYEPIVLIGSSMSAGPYFQAPQLMGFLGRHVRNISKDGFAGGYRAVDLLQSALTGRMPYPEVLVWEIPEDFIAREAEYFLEPLESLVALLPDAPFEAEQLSLDGMVIEAIDKSIDEGKVSYATQGSAGSVTLPLAKPVDGSAPSVLMFSLTVPPGSPSHFGETVVEWGTDPAAPPIGTKSVRMRITRWLHPILVQLTGGTPEAPIRYVRVRPFDKPSRIEMAGALEQWTSVDTLKGDAR